MQSDNGEHVLFSFFAGTLNSKKREQIKSANTHRIPSLCGDKLTNEAILLTEALVFVRLHRSHMFHVDCG